MTQTEPSLDRLLHTLVRAEIDRSLAVDGAEVGVSVVGGTVTVYGRVQSFAQKQAALSAVLGIPGVVAVADELDVEHSSDRPTDSSIAAAAALALQSSPAVPASVRATVHRREIMLSGDVSWESQRTAARRAVASLPGVAGVWSTMVVTHHPSQLSS